MQIKSTTGRTLSRPPDAATAGTASGEQVLTKHGMTIQEEEIFAR